MLYLQIEMITLVSNKKSPALDQIPIITEIISLDEFIDGKFYNENYLIIDGFETALFVEPKTKFLDHKIVDGVFWFFTEDDYKETDKEYFIELSNFIFETILLPERKKVQTTIIFELNQLRNLLSFKEGLIHFNQKVDIVYFLMDQDYLYEFDLNYFNYLYDNNNGDLMSLLQLMHLSESELDFFSKLKTYTDVKLNFKSKGLVEKKYNKNSFNQFYKRIDLKSDNKSEIDYYLLLFYSYLLKYKSDKSYLNTITIDGLNEQNSKFFTKGFLTKYSNPINNLFVVENYLSDIKLKNIDFEEAQDLVFPIKGNSIQYSYNGSDSTTGRIYTISDGGYQSLQTLPKERKKILIAEPGCFLIEFDYKTFEFNLLYQLAGIKIDKNKDHHMDMIKFIFSDKVLEDENKELYRKLGKQINYALIYGMNIEGLVDSILDDFFTEEDRQILEDSLVLEVRDLLKRKIKTSELFEIRDKLTQKILHSFHSNSQILKNYFNRFIHVSKSHAVLNNYIQSIAADFLCLKICMIIDLLDINSLDKKKNKILLQNHDSILLQLEAKVIDSSDILENIINIVDCQINDLVGISTFGYGDNWGEIS